MPDPPEGEKSHGNSIDLMDLRHEVPISRILKKKKSIFLKFPVQFGTLRPKTSQFYGRVRSEQLDTSQN